MTSFSLAVSENYTRYARFCFDLAHPQGLSLSFKSAIRPQFANYLLSCVFPLVNYSKRTGEKVDRTDWFRISVHHERMQEVVKTMVQKGSRVYVEGALKPRKWTDATGTERTTVEVVIRAKGEVVVVSKAADGSDSHSPHSDHESL